MNKKLLILFMSFTFSTNHAQELKHFFLENQQSKTETPARISLEGVSWNNNRGNLVLFERTDKGNKKVPAQMLPGDPPFLYFILPPSEKSRREFIMKQDENYTPEPGLKFTQSASDLCIGDPENPLLSYRFTTTLPGSGINPLYQRSGYIHPLQTPSGFVLTCIQPPDHYHHYGIWGPWTKTHIGNREVDFWNLAKGLGRVEFNEILNSTEGEVFTGFRVVQDHLDLGHGKKPRIALKETLSISVWNTGKKHRIIDYHSLVNCRLPEGITLNQYRYGGGISFRATEEWQKDNCTVLSSEGKTRANADGSKARWCLIEGESDAVEGRSGILIMSHPGNRMHPEPMRVWPEDAVNGSGQLMFNYTPTRNTSWGLKYGDTYSLRYRIVVFDGSIESQEADQYWKDFSEETLHPLDK